MLFSLISSKAGRRMRVDWQRPFQAPSTAQNPGLVSSPLLLLRQISAPWGINRTLAWPERDQGSQEVGQRE